MNEVLMHNVCKELPFGGVGDVRTFRDLSLTRLQSGMGAYNGKITFDEFTHHKGMLIRPQNSDVSLRFPPYTPNKLKWLERIDGFTRAVGKNKRYIIVGVIAIIAYFLHSKFF